VVRTFDELVAVLRDQAPWSATGARYRSFRRTFCSLEDGHATDLVLHLLADRTGMPLNAAMTASGGGNDDGASVRIHGDACSLDRGRERRMRLDPEPAQVLAADEHVG
jgi:hypothetical protein